MFISRERNPYCVLACIYDNSQQTVVVVNHSKAVRVGVTEELAGNDVRVALHQAEILAVESVLEPVQGLSTVMPLVNTGWYVTENVHLL